jgi:tetratricopeptide (TPR) repeat protein
VGRDAGELAEEDAPKVSEVLTDEILDELRQTARPHAFNVAARALADAVLALSEDDPEAAVAAGREAKGSAPRSGAVRELLGISLYQVGDYKAARTELAAAQRISGNLDLTAMLADVERATGRPEQAIELFRTTERTQMSADAAAELLVVAASAYGDMGQPGAGVALIRRHARWPAHLADHHLRIAYAEGALAERAGDVEAAKEAFERVTRTDPGFFDAAERLQRLERAAPD